MAGYILWGGGKSRGMLTELLLAEAGAAYEVRTLERFGGEWSDEQLAAVTPYGWAPALTLPSGETLVETAAINLWLCEVHGLDLAPAPGDPDRGGFLGALLNVTGELEPAMKRVFFPRRYAAGDTDGAVALSLAWEAVAARLAPIETRLATRGPHFLGARMSLADIHLVYWASYLEAAGRLGPFPAIAAALDPVRARPAMAEVWGRLLVRTRAWDPEGGLR